MLGAQKDIQQAAEPKAAAADYTNLASIGPLRVVLRQMIEDSGSNRVSALLEVIPMRSTPANTWGLSSVEGSPIR